MITVAIIYLVFGLCLGVGFSAFHSTSTTNKGYAQNIVLFTFLWLPLLLFSGDNK